MMGIAIDFETYYDKEYSIKTMGVDSYIHDERFDAYLVAVYDGDRIEYVGHPRDFDWSKVKGRLALAHNVRFDETVYLKLQETGIIPKACTPRDWFCTADMAVYLRAPRTLGGAVRALLGRTRDKSTREKLKGLTYEKACASGLKEEADNYALQDAKDCWELFKKFGDQWPTFEQRVSKKNREDSRRGVRINVDKLKEYLNDIAEVRWNAEKDIPWDWDSNKTPLAPTKLRLQCREAGIPCPTSLAQDSKECQLWEDTYGDNYPWVGAMRDWRRSNIVYKKLQAIEKRRQGDIFPYTIKYWGGHTGRFSGDGGFNMQNIYREPVMGVDFRSLFIPREDKVMMVADLSQIEARILLWLAGDMETLKQIANGFHPYEAHAVKSMGWDASKGKLKELDHPKYLLAKARVLGLGYQCGWERFIAMARILCGLELTPAESKATVKDFRATNPLIPKLWNNLHRGCAWSRGGDYSVELPSKRWMDYMDVKYTSKGLTCRVEIGGPRVKIYGGKIAENVTQATARDMFVEGMMKLHDAGIPQLWHVHDEYVLEVDKGTDPREIDELISVTPDWLEGCPIDTEITTSDCYGK